MFSSALLAVNSTHVETTTEAMREATTAAGSDATTIPTSLYYSSTSGKEFPFNLSTLFYFCHKSSCNKI